jgi:hypothetical protein
VSLGWLNLQEYLGANQQQVDELAQRLDAQQVALDTGAAEAAAKGNSMSYSDFLARRRTAAAMRQDDAGRAAMLGGDAGDAFLAGRGTSLYRAPTMASASELQRSMDARRKAESDYWAQQASRNKGLADAQAVDRRRQDEAHVAAKRAMEERAGGPGYRDYSQAVEDSNRAARGKQVRRISDEEWARWTR